MKRCRNEAHIRHRWLGDAPQQPRRGPQCGASRFVDELALSASDPEDLLEESGWRARLAATGWPTEPLPEVVVAAAETRLTGRLDPLGVTATLILVLWANAVLTGTRDRLRDVASATLAHYLDRTMSFHPTTYDSFAKLCRAAVDWADGRTEPRLPTTITPHRRRP